MWSFSSSLQNSQHNVRILHLFNWDWVVGRPFAASKMIVRSWFTQSAWFRIWRDVLSELTTKKPSFVMRLCSWKKISQYSRFADDTVSHVTQKGCCWCIIASSLHSKRKENNFNQLNRTAWNWVVNKADYRIVEFHETAVASITHRKRQY